MTALQCGIVVGSRTYRDTSAAGRLTVVHE
jgi:hypothetical protein